MTKKRIDIRCAHGFDEQHLNLLKIKHIYLNLQFRKSPLQNQDQILNIHTVIPNKVVFTIDARHKDPQKIKRVEQLIQDLPAEEDGCFVTSQKLWGRDTVVFDDEVCSHIAAASEAAGYSYERLYSGAGHDAQYIASVAPTAMIFVPSINGKSHCEEELTPYEDCAKGADVLLQTILQLQASSASAVVNETI